MEKLANSKWGHPQAPLCIACVHQRRPFCLSFGSQLSRAVWRMWVWWKGIDGFVWCCQGCVCISGVICGLLVCGGQSLYCCGCVLTPPFRHRFRYIKCTLLALAATPLQQIKCAQYEVGTSWMSPFVHLHPVANTLITAWVYDSIGRLLHVWSRTFSA